MTIPEFTLEGYRSTIAEIVGRGYEVRSFHDVEPRQRHLVLRHDVDQSIAIARALADVEAEQGWRSTWFILVRTEMYNPFSRANVANLRAMIAAGHEIGLHLDATYYDGSSALQSGAGIECEMLENMLGVPIKLVSFHRPTPSLVGSDTLVSGRQHTYMPRFVREMGYSSDSRGEWKHGHLWDHKSLRDGRALQLLTHAVWWVGPNGRTPVSRLVDMLNDKISETSVELSLNNTVWQEQQKKDR